MTTSWTRRLFVKRGSSGLAAAALASSATAGICAEGVNKAGILAMQGGTPVRSKPLSRHLADLR